MSATWRRRLLGGGLAIVLLAGLGGAAISAIEARKEVRVLCGMMKPGRSLASAVRMLDTIEWSAWARETSPAGVVIRMSSRWDLHLMRCEVNFADGVVQSASLDG